MVDPYKGGKRGKGGKGVRTGKRIGTISLPPSPGGKRKRVGAETASEYLIDSDIRVL
jgi:hypothetical protein